MNRHIINSHSPTETEDNIYQNTQQLHLKRSDVSELKPNASSFAYKIIISVLGLFMLVALTSLCVLGIFYHNKCVSTELLSKKYGNATATQILLDYKDKETERLYKELNMKHQELTSICGEKEKLYGSLKMKYEQVHVRLSACSANQNCKLCEEGWKSLGLKCYYFSTEKLNWSQSKVYCVQKGGHLVMITSKTEQDFVFSHIRETHWIGLNDLETEGKWMWVNNQSLKETGVMFWFSAPEGPNEPDNWKNKDPSGENCAALGNTIGNLHKWFDESCRTIKKCICEK